VFPDFPQTYGSISYIPAKSVSQNSVPPVNLTLLNSVPELSSFDNDDAPNLRRSKRTKHLPNYLKQYYCGTMTQIPSANPASSSCSFSGKPYSIFSFLTDSRLSFKHKAFTSAISFFFKPKSYKQVSSIPHWENAMTNEIKALEKNQTNYLVILPQNKSAIGCEWVYKVKFQVDGSVERYKAKLVAKGYTQQEKLIFLIPILMLQK